MNNIKNTLLSMVILLALLVLAGCALPGLTISLPPSQQTTTTLQNSTPEPINPTFIAPTISATAPTNALPDLYP